MFAKSHNWDSWKLHVDCELQIAQPYVYHNKDSWPSENKKQKKQEHKA